MTEPEQRPWTDTAPRATKYAIVGASAVSNVGVVPVLSFAFESIQGKMITVSFMATADGLKKFKNDLLRAYDECLREVKTIEKSIRDAQHDEEEHNE